MKEKQQLFIDIFAVTVVIYSFIHSFMHASRLYLGMSIGCLSTNEQEREGESERGRQKQRKHSKLFNRGFCESQKVLSYYIALDQT